MKLFYVITDGRKEAKGGKNIVGVFTDLSIAESAYQHCLETLADLYREDIEEVKQYVELLSFEENRVEDSFYE